MGFDSAINDEKLEKVAGGTEYINQEIIIPPMQPGETDEQYRKRLEELKKQYIF